MTIIFDSDGSPVISAFWILKALLHIHVGYMDKNTLSHLINMHIKCINEKNLPFLFHGKKESHVGLEQHEGEQIMTMCVWTVTLKINKCYWLGMYLQKIPK